MTQLFQNSFYSTVDGEKRFPRSTSIAWDVIGQVWCVWCGKYTGTDFENHHVFPKQYIKDLKQKLRAVHSNLPKTKHNSTTEIIFYLIEKTLTCWDSYWMVPVCKDTCHKKMQEIADSLGASICLIIFPDSSIDRFPKMATDTHKLASIAQYCFEEGFTQISAFLYLCIAFVESINNSKVFGWEQQWLASISTLKSSEVLAFSFVDLVTKYHRTLGYSEQNYLVNALLHGSQIAKNKATDIFGAMGHRPRNPLIKANNARRLAMISQSRDDVDKSAKLTEGTNIPYSIRTAYSIKCLYFMYADYKAAIEHSSFVIDETESHYQKIEATVFSAAATYFHSKTTGEHLSDDALNLLLTRLYRAESISAIYGLQAISIIDKSNNHVAVPLAPQDLINLILNERKHKDILGNNALIRLAGIRSTSLSSVRRAITRSFGYFPSIAA